jgi:O-antigen/teichoic acid export membrane protein
MIQLLGRLTSGGTYQQILHGAIVASIATITAAIANVLLTALAIRSLPQELSGVYFLFLNFSALIMLADIGLSPTLSREIAFSIGGYTQPNAEKRMGVLLGTTFRLLCVTAAVVFFTATLLGTMYFYQTVSSKNQLGVVTAWWVFALGSAINIFAASGLAGLAGLGLVPLERSIRIVVTLLGLLLCSAAIWMGYGLMGLAIAWALQGITTFFLSWFWILRKRPHILKTLQYDAKLTKRLLLTSGNWALTSLGAFLIFNTANLMIGYHLGAEKVSSFSLVVRMAAFAQTLGLSLTISAAPHISREYAANNIEEVKRILNRNLILGMTSVFIPVVLIAFFAPQILELWVGSGHFAGYVVLIPYLLMTLLETHHVIHATVVMATGDLPFAPWAIASGIFTALLCYVSIPVLGLLGASLSILFSQLITNNWYAPYYSIKKFSLGRK